jgi:hypothetical protein
MIGSAVIALVETFYVVGHARLLPSLLLSTFLTVALWLWGRWVSRRQGGGRWRVTLWLPLIGFSVAIAGATLQMVSATTVFPSKRLADGYVETVRWGLLLGMLLYLASFVLCMAGSIRRPTATTPEP